MGRKRKKVTKKMTEARTETQEVVVEARVDLEPVYAFPSRSRCPRCKSINTVAHGKHGGTQYRVCQQPICRKRYSVAGSAV